MASGGYLTLVPKRRRNAMVTAQRGSPDVDAGGSPKPDRSWQYPIRVTTWLIPEDDQWIALAEEFDVAGCGPTQEAAMRNMDELLIDYFGLVAEEGKSPADARRRISLARRAKLELGRLHGSIRSRATRGPYVDRVPHQAHC